MENNEDKTLIIEAKAEISPEELTEDEIKDILKESYKIGINILKNYLDLKEEYYKIIVLWIIGTYFHKSFVSYPYLFFNAIKGSGKSRTLKLIAELSSNGSLVTNITEAVLFRDTKNHTLAIDEFENIGRKGKEILRELLNSAYKQGVKVKRAYKWKGEKREGQSIEEFEVYKPITMANISGMDDVLGERCISLVLEKSTNKNITRKIELFYVDKNIQNFKQKVELSRVFFKKSNNNIVSNLEGWNKYIEEHIYLLNSTSNITTQNSTYSTYLDFYNKIWRTSLDGRYLELFYPLFIIANMVDCLDEILLIAEKVVAEKKEEDIMEGRDISLLNFIATYEFNFPLDFIPIREIVNPFKEAEDEEWINSKWLGRALKRLNIIKRKRKVRGRIELIIDFDKAKEKIRVFQDIQDDTEIKEKIKNLEIVDTNSKECIECGLKTSFIFSDGKCELCTGQNP